MRSALLGKLVRSLLLAAAVVAYVKGRRWLAVDDLVRIFRKVCIQLKCMQMCWNPGSLR